VACRRVVDAIDEFIPVLRQVEEHGRVPAHAYQLPVAVAHL
jgi:hypothetical protein